MKFKKKPVIVDAMIWTGANFDDVKSFVGEAACLVDGELVIKTLEDGNFTKAKHVATAGDYVIRGVKGEYYFCKPDIFEMTYEECNE